ncbi:hypothetical protein FKW77_001622 [Venturia effusa]|uniref:Uncharacterized protein n=1 Tax=Venturia effusa TaxID=50376 RepID=A0A517L8P9_9PEZI|nr:hypothetical protein FKW77_001622 [Venturia effusa]
MLIFLFACFCSCIVVAFPSLEPPKRQEVAKRQGVSEPICGQIIDAVNDGFSLFYASDAYDCLRSVPFNPAVATRFVRFFNETLQFQSTLAYLKTPPNGYQQPAIDVVAKLNEIQTRVNSGYYQNEYAFEQDIYLLAYAAHDDHVDLSAGILSVFSFASPYYISSVSVDGKQAPQIFFTGDIIDSQAQGWTPSPIVQINGQDVIEFLTDFAALQSAGTLEPHADWNQLFASPAQDIQGFTNVFGGGATFYPGDELNFTLANATDTPIETFWVAFYDIVDCTGPLTTGGDFYNYFVLGLLPDSYNASAGDCVFDIASSASDASATGSMSGAIMQGLDPTTQTTSWANVSSGAYPSNPAIVQPDLSLVGGGILTGYFLNDISTGVLSIPSFAVYGDGADTFASTVAHFISSATTQKMSRVIIDLQQNKGGDISLAINTFRQFFPNIDIFGGSRRRNHRLENIVGATTTDFWNKLDQSDAADEFYHYLLAADEWVVTDRINADTGALFQSWEEFNGPRHYHDDDFSLTERYNLSDPVFNSAAFNFPYPIGYDPKNKTSQTPPWQPKDLVILTDGLCSSACVLFLEMMTHQAGVRTVVMGGRPNGPAPMQAASGNRGAILYDADSLTDDITFAASVNETANAVLPDRSDSGIYFDWITFNLRDQIRGKDTDPLQFKYIPANCRLYYKLSNAYNMTNLWHDVANANWNDSSLCVPGSISVTDTPIKAPPLTNITVTPPLVNWPVDDTELASIVSDGSGGIQDGGSRSGRMTECSDADYREQLFDENFISFFERPPGQQSKAKSERKFWVIMFERALSIVVREVHGREDGTRPLAQSAIPSRPPTSTTRQLPLIMSSFSPLTKTLSLAPSSPITKQLPLFPPSDTILAKAAICRYSRASPNDRVSELFSGGLEQHNIDYNTGIHALYAKYQKKEYYLNGLEESMTVFRQLNEKVIAISLHIKEACDADEDSRSLEEHPSPLV